jgi:hypothetical protein
MKKAISNTKIEIQILLIFFQRGVIMNYKNIFILLALIAFYSAFVLSRKILPQPNVPDNYIPSTNNKSLEFVNDQFNLRESDYEEVDEEESVRDVEEYEEDFEDVSRIENPENDNSRSEARETKKKKRWWQFWK